MLFDALDSYLSAKDEESKLKKKMAAGGDTGDVAGADSMSPADAQRLQNLQATTNQNFLEHLGTTLGARMLGKTGIDAFGIGQGNQAIQNAMQYQQIQRPQMMQAGSTQGLHGALNVPASAGGREESNLERAIGVFQKMYGAG